MDPFATTWTMPAPGQWTEEQKREYWKPGFHAMRLMLSTEGNLWEHQPMFCDLCIMTSKGKP